MSNISGFTKGEQAGIMLGFVALLAQLFFLYDVIDGSNIYTMFVELGFAGLMGFILARYFFNKDKELQKREKEENEKERRNEFEYRLKKAHVMMLREINEMGTGMLSKISIQTLRTLLQDAVLAFKIYKPADIDSEKILNNATMLVEKHEKNIINNIFLADLKVSQNALERVGEKYRIDLASI